MTLAKSLQSAAGNAAADANYIEDVFSTYLYTGTSGTGGNPVIVNGIDLAGKGGLVWFKDRTAVTNHGLFDTVRGVGSALASNLTNGNITGAPLLSFNGDGFSLTNNTFNANTIGDQIASWTFRKSPKFFDVVTYTGNGVAGRQIAHSLGSAPGAIIVKRTDTTGNWPVWHRSGDQTDGKRTAYLNLTAPYENTATAVWNNTAVPPDMNAATFTVGVNDTNANGGTYVAYLFAHNAGGFGLSGEDNVISCGSFTSDGAGAASVTLGYEPQWILYKPTSTTGDWRILDNMRGWAFTNNSALFPNWSGAEIVNTNASTCGVPTATGFSFAGGLASSATYIYIAIRRGPMKVPESGTSVYNAIATTGTGSTANITGVGFSPDLLINSRRADGSVYDDFYDRLRGVNANLRATTYAEDTSRTDELMSINMDGVTFGASSAGWLNYPNYTYINWFFRRAPGFFDVVCYTGNGAGAFDPVPYVNHNLGVPFELVIIKRRNSTSDWGVYCSLLTPTPSDQGLALNTTAAAGSILSPLQNYAPSAINFVPETPQNISGAAYVAYLFASAPGVSKVFNYTGNGSSQTINCGFTGGARFVMIKRTDSTGDWYVWDTARGIVANSDPHLSLNTTAAEVTTDDSVDTASTGFIVNQLAATNINVSSATYIGLAIA